MNASATRKAVLYRMVTPEHTCPWGLKALNLLRREGFKVDDHHLTSREATDAFKAQHQVETTPQTFIGGRRVGGYDELREFLGKETKDKDAVSYRPVVALFGMALAMALAASWAAYGNIATVAAAEWFVAFAMCLLALQKIKDVDGFATMFLNYDLLAQRWVRYAYILSFCRGPCRRSDDRGNADVDLDPRGVVHRRHRRDLGLQGRLCRQARAEMRLRRR